MLGGVNSSRRDKRAVVRRCAGRSAWMSLALGVVAIPAVLGAVGCSSNEGPEMGTGDGTGLDTASAEATIRLPEDVGTISGSPSEAEYALNDGGSGSGPVISRLSAGKTQPGMEVDVEYCDRSPGAVNAFTYTATVLNGNTVIGSETLDLEQTDACNRVTLLVGREAPGEEEAVVFTIDNHTNAVSAQSTAAVPSPLPSGLPPREPDSGPGYGPEPTSTEPPVPASPGPPGSPLSAEEVVRRITDGSGVAPGIPRDVIRVQTSGIEEKRILVGPYDNADATLIIVGPSAPSAAASLGVGTVGTVRLTRRCALVSHPAANVFVASERGSGCPGSTSDPRWARALAISVAIGK